ncbi:IWS1 [Candida oxycetoniae]|uniref:IWS1 n=1 Tax=Candida oxycetoniae TaxID=497107 RepID=A0AAI9WXI7_9ASCO|nr:IWS1 [Candida oxycetoniae]KAI3404351.1 IWS1 [Candida oxycetoniae]
MGDPLADFTNLSQDEFEPEQYVNSQNQETQQEEEAQQAQQAEEDIELPQDHELLEAAEYPQRTAEDDNGTSGYASRVDDQQEEQVPSSVQVDEKVKKEDEHQEEEDEHQEDVDEEEVIKSLKAKKLDENQIEHTQKKLIRKPKPPIHQVEEMEQDYDDFPSSEKPADSREPSQRKRMELEERMTAAMTKVSTRRKRVDEDDLEQIDDKRVQDLKDEMIAAANADVEKNIRGEIATEKLKMLDVVMNVLSRADMAIAILDNNLLDAIRTWLEPLPDASMPAYQIQKDLISALENLPIKTEHLTASSIGKVLVFYQRSKRTEPQLKKIVDRLIGDWTRPLLNKSDSYRDRTIQFGEYNKTRFANQLSRPSKKKESKTLYEQNAERRKRAAIPTARTAAYKIAPRVDKSLLMRQAGRGAGYNEGFKKLNQKLSTMSTKRKAVKKGGPSIEGRDLSI